MAHTLINIAFVAVGLIGLAVMAITILHADGRL
jgi:hypothetical protein